jgi:hypothetical protein
MPVSQVVDVHVIHIVDQQSVKQWIDHPYNQLCIGWIVSQIESSQVNLTDHILWIQL